MLTGNGVMHDGEAILEDYGYRPERVKVCYCVMSGVRIGDWFDWKTAINH